MDEAEKPEKKSRAATEKQVRMGARRLADDALNALEAIINGDGQDSVRLAAAREVLDRAYGRNKLGAADGKPDGAPYTVVVQRFSDPPDPKVGDFD
jgi:hypothetical protein